MPLPLPGLRSRNAICSKRAQGLILGADRDIVLSQDGQKPFQFMLTGQMQRQVFEEVAISHAPNTLSPLGCECKMFASNAFLESPHRFLALHSAF